MTVVSCNGLSFSGLAWTLNCNQGTRDQHMACWDIRQYILDSMWSCRMTVVKTLHTCMSLSQ